jgi:hypothetical protein
MAGLKARLTHSDGNVKGSPDLVGTEDGLEDGSLDLDGLHGSSLDLDGIYEGNSKGLLHLDGTQPMARLTLMACLTSISQQMVTVKPCLTWMTQRIAYLADIVAVLVGGGFIGPGRRSKKNPEAGREQPPGQN